MNRFQAILVAFEPATESQKLLYGETLRAYNEPIGARRSRLDAVNTVVFVTVFAGQAGLSLSTDPDLERRPDPILDATLQNYRDVVNQV